MIARLFIKQKTKTNSPFDYEIRSKGNLSKFTLLSVPFGQTNKIGFLDSLKIKSSHKTKEAIKVLSSGAVFTPFQDQLAQKIAAYYLVPYGLTLFSFLPNLPKKYLLKIGSNSILTQTNSHTLREIFLGRYSDRLELFCQLSSKSTSRQNLYLVPTKAGINYAVKKIKKISPNLNIFSWHSGLKNDQKAQIWQTLLSSQPAVVIGSRDALLLPFTTLETIFIDDPTNFAYQEDQLPYFNAYKAAYFLSETCRSNLIIGDETPDMSAYIAIGKKTLKVQNIPSQFNFIFAKSWFNISSNEQILDQIKSGLKRKQRLCVIGPFKNQIRLYCQDCENQIKCQNCESELFEINNLTCLKCGQPVSEICPKCQSVRIKKMGFTYKQIKEDLAKIFQNFSNKISRYGDPMAQISIASESEIPLLAGAYEMAILPYFEVMLNFPHLGGRQKLFRLVNRLKSVSVKKVYLFGENLQDNDFVKQLVRNDWAGFLYQELRERKKLSLPPFSKAFIVESKAKNQTTAEDNLQEYLKKISHLSAIKLISEKKTKTFKAKALFYLNANDWQKNKNQLIRNLSGDTQLKIDPIDYI